MISRYPSRCHGNMYASLTDVPSLLRNHSQMMSICLRFRIGVVEGCGRFCSRGSTVDHCEQINVRLPTRIRSHIVGTASRL